MSGPEFESLYYTDCVPGQGLRGGAGFQFQAVSPGVSHETMALVQRTALYEAPVAWMREQRAVEDYPPSLTHVFDGVYATARGRYLGAEANGVREGNQFTHAIATTDPETYGLVRPAQLWEAPWWVERPAATTECEPVVGDPEAGRWGIDPLREWVLGRPDGADWLMAVHSAFDRVHDGGQRVLFVGTDPAAVLGWIAAGTVLLAQSRALRVGFRVFATNPRQSRHEVLAVHEDWAGALANPDRDNGFVVFNLSTGRHSSVEPTDGARFWVPRFLSLDPYDVVDAIELTQLFAGGTARPSAVDRFAGAVAVLDEAPENSEQARELVRWLRHAPADLPDEVVQAVTIAVLAFRLDVDTLTELHDTMRERVMAGDLPGRVLLALFAAELERDLGTSVDAGDGTMGSLADAAAAMAPPERMDVVLRTATRYQVRPRIGAFVDSAQRFVRWSADRPAERFEPTVWSCGTDLLDLFRDELAARLERQRGRDEVSDAVRTNWWRVLLPSVTDPAAPLDAVVTAAAVEQGDARVRRGTIHYVLTTLRSAPRTQRAPLMWRALFSYSSPSPDELIEFLHEVPPGGLTGWCADHTLAELERPVRTRPSSTVLDALALSVELGARPDGQLAAVARQDRTVREWLDHLGRGRPARSTDLVRVREPVLAARKSAVVDTLLDRVTLALAVGMVERSGEALPALLVRALPDVWRREGEQADRTAAAVALAFVTAHLDNCADLLAVEVERPLLRWVKAADEQGLRRVERLLAGVGDLRVKEWREFVGGRAPRGAERKRARGGAAPAKSPAPRERPAGWPFSRRQKER